MKAIQCEIGEELPLLGPPSPPGPLSPTGPPSSPIIQEMVQGLALMFSLLTHKKEMQKLLIGVFLEDLKRKLENFGNESETSKKLNLYETVS